MLACQCSLAEPLFDLNKYRSWMRVVRITAWIHTSIHNCRVHNSRRLMGPLTAAGIKDGEFTWMKNAQAAAFGIELAALSKDEPLPKASHIRDLHSLVNNHGILRIKTWLDNMKASEDVRCPILLPAENRCTYLIIDSTHRRLLHIGVNDTLSELRECFWVIKSRQCIKKVIFTCKVCARFKFQPATAPTAPLPPDRVERSHPFQVVVWTLPVLFLLKDLKVMYRMLRNFQVQDFCSTKQIAWKFIAWWGGFWERMIRAVKSCLRKTLGKGFFDFEQLTTILTEAENVVNSRPLSYLPSEATEPVVLTPSHFLTVRKSTTLPSSNAAETSGSRSDTLKHWRYRQRRVKDFWTRWYKEYLLCLKCAHQGSTA